MTRDTRHESFYFYARHENQKIMIRDTRHENQKIMIRDTRHENQKIMIRDTRHESLFFMRDTRILNNFSINQIDLCNTSNISSKGWFIHLFEYKNKVKI